MDGSGGGSVTIIIQNTSQEAAISKPGRRWYEWSIYMQSEPQKFLDNVETVIYHLHPTFSNQEIAVHDRESDFKLDGSGWGEFTVRLDVILKNGKKLELEHYLSLHGKGETRKSVPADKLLA